MNNHPDTSSPLFEQLIDGLMEKNWAAPTFLFPADGLERLRQNLLRKLGQGQLRSAGIGNHTQHVLDKGIRSDQIGWMENDSTEPAERLFLDTVEALGNYLNRTCYTGIRTHEFHYACFAPGAFYKRHIDRFRNDNARKFSMITYLNPDWGNGSGGELVLYTPEGPISIRPDFGTTVIFKSDVLEHEVLPATQNRLSITGWLK